jgi:hypothetical protein
MLAPSAWLMIEARPADERLYQIGAADTSALSS